MVYFSNKLEGLIAYLIGYSKLEPRAIIWLIQKI